MGFYHYWVNVKMYHWTTQSDPRHRATDQLLSKILEQIDKFVEMYIAHCGIQHFQEDIPPIIIKPISEDEIMKCLDSWIDYIRTVAVPKTEGVRELTTITDDMVNEILQCKFFFRMK